jgi:predicted permease
MGVVGDVRYALRALGKSPVFTAVAVLSLALGIGANTAVYSLVDSVLLSLLPVKDPGELVQLKEVGRHYGSNTGMNALSYPIYEDFRNQNQVFSGMFSRFQTPVSVSDAGRNERAQGELVSGTYFQVLGVGAALGRVFTAEDDRTRSGAPYAVLAYDYWQTRYASDRRVIGREILVNDHKLTIVGVAERGFEGVGRLWETQIYIPVMMEPQIGPQIIEWEKALDDRRRRWVQVFARLKPGVSVKQAKASLAPIFHHVLELEVEQKEFAHASAYAREQFLKQALDVMPGGTGQNEGREFLGPALVAMMALVGLVLLIACANVANLMVARSTARQKEIAVRLSLGASRGRLLRQLLVESVLLALAGGVVGFALVPPTIGLLANSMPQMDPPVRYPTAPSLEVLGFALAVSLATAVLFGLAPALQTTRPDLAATLKDQASAVAGGHARWRKMLAAAQVSLSLVLLIAAGLFVRSLANLKNLNPGFDVNHLLTFSVDPTLSGYKLPQAKAFYKQLTQELSAVPGVNSEALCVVAPLSYDEWDSSVTVEGYAAKPGEDMNPWDNYVSPGFFTTLRIPILAGRDFTDRDTGTPKVAIVNQKFARHFFGDKPAVGRHIGMGSDPGTKTDIEIVGVVGDTRYQTMKQEPPRQIFFPYLQSDWAAQMTAYVRTDVSPPQMYPALRAVVRRLSPNLPVYLMKTEERQRDDSMAVELLAASLSGAFGVLATVLAGIGLYGVMAFVVSRRTREIGIRIALGALTTDVVWLVMREVALLAGAGLVAGMAAALAITGLLGSQLFGIRPNDPATIALAVAGIASIAAVSGYIPARRATRVDPLTAIRWE